MLNLLIRLFGLLVLLLGLGTIILTEWLILKALSSVGVGILGLVSASVVFSIGVTFYYGGITLAVYAKPESIKHSPIVPRAAAFFSGSVILATIILIRFTAGQVFSGAANLGFGMLLNRRGGLGSLWTQRPCRYPQIEQRLYTCAPGNMLLPAHGLNNHYQYRPLDLIFNALTTATLFCTFQPFLCRLHTYSLTL